LIVREIEVKIFVNAGWYWNATACPRIAHSISSQHGVSCFVSIRLGRIAERRVNRSQWRIEREDYEQPIDLGGGVCDDGHGDSVRLGDGVRLGLPAATRG